MTEIKITLADFRNPRSRVCVDPRTGAKPTFFVPNGLDWKRFCKEGMTPDELRAPGQHLDLIDRLENSARARLNLPLLEKNVG